MHCVASGEEAIAYLQRSPPDAVILDMVMPGGMDGRKTYARIAQLDPGPPTLLVSGHSETEAVSGARSLGARPLLQKPFRLAQLAQELDGPLIATRPAVDAAPLRA